MFKPRNNLPSKEHKAIRNLRSNSDIVIKKADKGSTTVIMNTKDKTQEGQVLLVEKNNYMPLATPMVEKTACKTRAIIDDLHQGNHIGTMTKKWLLQTPKPQRIPVFYMLTKIHKPTLPGRPIILGCDRAYIIISRPHTTTYRSSTKILPQRYHTVYQLYRKEGEFQKLRFQSQWMLTACTPIFLKRKE